MTIILETERLILRRWKDCDLDAFAAINADPRVAEFLPSTRTRDQTVEMITALEAFLEEHGFGFWALEEKANGELIGFTGLGIPGFEAHFTPCTEIGWRLACHRWGQGFASEAARAALAYAFGPLNRDEVVAFTTRGNLRSRAVMERVGMTHDPADDFDHPRLPEDHPIRPHVLYRIRRA